MKKLVTFISVCLFVLLSAACFNACKPIRNLTNPPVPYNGNNVFNWKAPVNDASKKNVFIIADNKVTELFDMLAPFYLFNATGKANVYVVAKMKSPILIKRDLFILPQITFKEADSMKLQADVIVMPALSVRNEKQDPVIISWVKAHYTSTTKLLSVCDGASTAAATGLYDGKLLTCHASDFEGIKSRFSKPVWVKDISVTKDGNLFSTAGVSNAVNGSLMVIDEMFGPVTMQAVAANINFPYSQIKTRHQSIAIDFRSKLNIAKKVMFHKNRHVDILLDKGMSEFALASILDTYGRSFPASLKTISMEAYKFNDTTIQTKYGLTLVCMGDRKYKKADELHVLMPGLFSKEDAAFFRDTKIVQYDSSATTYPIDTYLERISKLYGHRFEKVVKLMLDYN